MWPKALQDRMAGDVATTAIAIARSFALTFGATERCCWPLGECTLAYSAVQKALMRASSTYRTLDTRDEIIQLITSNT